MVLDTRKKSMAGMMERAKKGLYNGGHAPLGYDIKNYPQAYENFKGEISLPIYPQLDGEKLSFIIRIVKEAYWKVIGDK
mgnify:CR=1 FL=1